MRNKKGDLALSTNAIVVLIIAITILGLALAFTRNIFGSLGKQIEDIGKQTLIDNPPTFDKPMTLSKEEFDIRRGTSVSLGVGFYNHYENTTQAFVILNSCYQGTNPTTDQFAYTTPGPKTTRINEAVAFSTSIMAKDNAASGVHACTLMIMAKPISLTTESCNPDGSSAYCNYEYKDVLVKVK